MSTRLFNGEVLPAGVPRPSEAGLCWGGVYMRSLRGDGQARSPRKVRLVNRGSDRSPGRGVAG